MVLNGGCSIKPCISLPTGTSEISTRYYSNHQKRCKVENPTERVNYCSLFLGVAIWSFMESNTQQHIAHIAWNPGICSSQCCTAWSSKCVGIIFALRPSDDFMICFLVSESSALWEWPLELSVTNGMCELKGNCHHPDFKLITSHKTMVY